MAQFPSKWITICNGLIAGDKDPGVVRSKLDTLERKVTDAAEACVRDGFVPAVNPALGADGNIIVFIHPSAPVQRQPGQVQPATPAMVPHLLEPPA